MSSVICKIFELSEKIPLDIHTASSIGHYDKVERIINKLDSQNVSEFLNSPNREGWTPLMFAAHGGRYDVVQLLLKNGANANQKTDCGLTSLMTAAECGHRSTAVLLLNHGANLHECDKKGRSALFYACSYGHFSVVQLLLEKKALVNLVDDDGLSCLMIAAESGRESIVKELLRNNADISLCSKKGETASTLAYNNGNLKIKTVIDLFIPSKLPTSQKSTSVEPKNLYSLLEGLNLTKYYNIFEEHGINLKSFWTLSDKDLIELGIKLLGPRKKITLAIERWRHGRDLYALY